MAATNLPTINACWIGPRMGKMHAACLQSFVRQGHRVVLHAYDPPIDCPNGVELADASKLLSRDMIRAHGASGSFSLTADILRFEILASGAGIYVDCDCYCVRPLDDEHIILGLETDTSIATGVLNLPVDSPLLSDMRAIATTRGFIPPWESGGRQRKYRLRAALGVPTPLAEMRWGTMGPLGISYYAKRHGLFDKAKPADTYYPVCFYQAALLRDPDLSLADLITPRTRIVHLWNEVQRNTIDPPPIGSPLHLITETLTI